MNSHNLDSLMRSRTRHAPSPELDARVRQMIAAHPRHAAAPHVPGPFTWRDWCHVALALSLVPMVILSFYLVLPSDMQSTMTSMQQQRLTSCDDDWSQPYMADAAWKGREPQFTLFFRSQGHRP